MKKPKENNEGKKKTQVQETVPSFIFRVQTAHRYITDACEPGEYCIPLKNRQTAVLGTRQSLYNSQERSVMFTGKKKIMNLDGKEFFTSKFKMQRGPLDFPALVLFPMVSPQGVIVRWLGECVYSHFAPISMFTLWKRDAFSPGAEPTSCQLRIAALR